MNPQEKKTLSLEDLEIRESLLDASVAAGVSQPSILDSIEISTKDKKPDFDSPAMQAYWERKHRIMQKTMEKRGTRPKGICPICKDPLCKWFNR